MATDGKNIQPTTSASNGKEDKSDSKKYNFYRKPSIKKKAPEVKQTLTSYKRMLKANPLLKYELEGQDLSSLVKQHHISANGHGKVESAPNKNFRTTEKQSLQPNLNGGRPKVPMRPQTVKNPPKPISGATRRGTTSIISGSKQLGGKTTSCTNISRQSNVDFNTSTSRFLCSTRLENNCSKSSKIASANCKTEKCKTRVTQDNSVTSSGNSTISNAKDKQKKCKPRRSLSAQHFDRKKGGTVKFNQQNSVVRIGLSQSLENVSILKEVAVQYDISPIAEGSHETSIIFKTPSAYERRSIAKSTPKSAVGSRRSLYRPMTPLPSLSDLQKRLNDWLSKRGKSLSSFHHLKSFGVQEKPLEIVDEENKENIEVENDLDKGSYEDLRIEGSNCDRPSENVDNKAEVLNTEGAETIAKAALEDLLKLIQDGYPTPQCEGWLELIRQKYKKLEEEPQYWECRAAIEQSRGNITNAVQCYRTAIVQGAEIQTVDESLDVLLQKFSLLNISTKDVEGEKSVKERARIVRDARNVFKSSIIQFAVQERKLKKETDSKNEKKLVATPVRRSTRLSRSAYTSTPGVKIFSSLQELENSDREILDFKKNKALF